MSRHKINTPIFALTPSVSTQRKVSLYRGVQAYNLQQGLESSVVLKQAEDLMIAKGIVKKGDLIVVTWGEPIPYNGDTDRKALARDLESTIRRFTVAALRGNGEPARAA